MRRILALLALLLALAPPTLGALVDLRLDVTPDPKLRWNAETRRMSAAIESTSLREAMSKLGAATGWKVFLDPAAERTVTAQFTDKPTGDALRLLLGSLNFAVVPESTGPSKLFVFKNEMRDATQAVEPAKSKRGKDWISNEILVTFRKGAHRNIDELARQLGAKIVGRNDKLGTYRLAFDSDEAAERARQNLDSSNDLRVDDNYYLHNPDPNGSSQFAESPPEFNLKPNSNNDPNHTIVAVVDTAIQAIDPAKSAFLLPGIDVAGPGDPAKLADATPLHGTAMVDTFFNSVADSSTGQAESNIRVLPINVYGGNETTTTYEVTLGVYQALTSGADVVSMSFGGDGDSPLLDNLLAQGSKNGVLFFGAAGNTPTTAPTYPAANPVVYAVTAADRNGQIASYANTGSFVDLIAPGTSYINFSDQTYRIMGTSPATATVAGYAATTMSQGKSGAEVAAAIASKFGLKR